MAFSYSIGTCFPNAVNEVAQNNTIAVTPNPANTILHISSEDKIKHISLSNSIGTIVQTTSSNSIHVENIPNGIYFVTIVTEKIEPLKK